MDTRLGGTRPRITRTPRTSRNRPYANRTEPLITIAYDFEALDRTRFNIFFPLQSNWSEQASRPESSNEETRSLCPRSPRDRPSSFCINKPLTKLKSWRPARRGMLAKEFSCGAWPGDTHRFSIKRAQGCRPIARSTCRGTRFYSRLLASGRGNFTRVLPCNEKRRPPL